MVRAILRFTLLALCCQWSLLALAQGPQVDVSVDRSELARGETLTLTIRVHDQRQGMQLDLTSLTEEFDVLATRTSSQIRSVNGNIEQWTDYVVTLFPLTEGELTIPALDINETRTDPIAITVVNEGPRSNQDGDELFLEIEASKDSLYVQEQLQFNVRLYYTINGIRNPQFTELEIPDTVIQMIGTPNQYERLIDGVRYGVYEKRYVIFPQRSGELVIPDILFRGEVTDGSSNFVFRNLNTRRVTAFTDGMSVQVQERPAEARELDYWLPANSLTLEESWSIDPGELQVGDSTERTVTMVAEGLDGAMLPPFSPERVEGLNLYDNPPQIERTFVDGAIVGTRIETTTIVPTASGEIVVPEIRVPWWNVDSDQMEASIIPATTLDIAAVAGDLPSEQTIASSENLEELLAQAPTLDQSMIDAQAEEEFIEVDALWLNLIIAAALLTVLYSIYRLVYLPNRWRVSSYLDTQGDRLTARYSAANNEGVAFKQLLKACRSKNLPQARKALTVWSDHFIESRVVRSMEDILQQQEAPELHRFAAAIQASLYNQAHGIQQSVDFRPEELQQTVTRLRSEKRKRRSQHQRDERYALPPLYKS